MDRIIVSFLTPSEVLMDHNLHRSLPLPVWLACDVDSPKDQLLATFQKQREVLGIGSGNKREFNSIGVSFFQGPVDAVNRTLVT